MSFYEQLAARSDLADMIRSKDEAYTQLLGNKECDRISAAEMFAAKAHEVYDYAANTENCDTLCFMSNVKTLREQTAEILEAAGRDNEVRSVIAPLAQELHIRL